MGVAYCAELPARRAGGLVAHLDRVGCGRFLRRPERPANLLQTLSGSPTPTRKGVEQMKVKSNVKAGSYRARGTTGGFEE